MKKLIFLLLSVYTSVCYAQFTVPVLESTSMHKEYMYNSKNNYIPDTTDYYFAVFHLTPVGIKEAIDGTEKILLSSGLSFDKPDCNESFLSSTVKGYHDYEAIYNTVIIDFSKIYLVWYKGVWKLSLKADKDYIGIYIDVNK